ncbi:MAG: hypothetical protein HY914_19710 [Desulfomonile tiedjei]|nr:hypothetical protein [Desulfomonile tiedjei]
MKLKWVWGTVVLLVSLIGAMPARVSADGLFGSAGTNPFGPAVEPTIFIGYLSQPAVPVISIVAPHPPPPSPAGGLSSFSVSYRLSGLWTEFVLPINGAGAGFLVGGGWLFAPRGSSETNYSFTNFASSSAARDWQTSAEWYNLRVAVTYNLYPAVALVAGLRLENFQFKGETTQTVLPPQRAVYGDRADLAISTYIPILGVMAKRVGMGGQLTVNGGVVGSPFLWGSVNYIETALDVSTLFNTGGIRIAGRAFPVLALSNEFGPGGYFVETFVDCSLSRGPVTVGAFFKLDIMNGKAKVDPGERLGRVPFVGGIFPKVEYDLRFQAYNSIIGGQVGFVW